MALSRLVQAEALLQQSLILDILCQYRELSMHLDDPDFQKIQDLAKILFVVASVDEALFAVAQAENLI
ncbi:hypothetical protein D0436_10985 [Shewanella decolorationis]|uniref:Uncharacterized protein n=1 Tax=Shewanella decolorationis TaxID=256839 RepID=A0A5B8QYC4_9GAMM|nr:hypothetical protein [Shewanella decolorationis]QDZ90949.1 hypothetical protein D0436_10985 [Shewanella decolorationis]